MTFLKFSRFVGSSSPDLMPCSGNVEGCKVSCSVLNLPSDSLCRTYLLCSGVGMMTSLEASEE